MMKQLLFFLSASFLMSGCAYFRSSSDLIDTSGFNLAQVKADLKPLDGSKPYVPSEAIEEYFNFYELNPTNAQHYFGTVDSEGSTIAGHIFIPEQPRGTLFLIHGYFDHTGTLANLINEGLIRNYAVIAWDLPGHGLSSGVRTDTGSFNLCSEQFVDIVNRTKDLLPRPFHLVAHSTGCSIAIEYLYTQETSEFEEVVFLAPLVRHKHWGWAKFGYAISRPFTKTIKRRDKKNSSDEAYMAFVKKDPLHSSVLSYEYLRDLYRWEKNIRDYPTRADSIVIIQGDKDSIVDWKYNLEFIPTKFPDTNIFMIPGANHQLVNEVDEYRTQTFTYLFKSIEPR